MTNSTIIVGNLTKDPELRYSASGVAVANLNVAVNRRTKNGDQWEDILDGFYPVTIWKTYAENVAESLHKGDRVVVVGRITTRTWQDKDGNDRKTVEIDAEEVAPSLRWARADVSKAGGSGQRQQPKTQTRPAVTADDQIPF